MRRSPLRTVLRVDFLEDRLAPATFTVTTIADTLAGSFREALTRANARPGTDTIVFNVLGGGLQTIDVFSPLPAITDPVVIAGQTQPGFAGTPLIELNGTAAGLNSGLRIMPGGSGSIVRGLVINRFFGTGIDIRGDNCRVVGCYIGTNPGGNTAQGNGIGGVTLSHGASNNAIGGTTATARNVISGNANWGVSLADFGTTGNRVLGNFIGTDASGLAALGNSTYGVEIETNVGGNFIGGAEAGASNVISGNGINGVALFGAAAGNRVKGNLIGTNANGTAALPNTADGVRVFNSRGMIVGGAVAGARNTISGNGGAGILIEGDPSRSNRVLGNFIGTDVFGIADLGNAVNGVAILGGASDNTIGGALAGSRNVISGNGASGVSISDIATRNNTVLGNFIGIAKDGMTELGNAGFGVAIHLAASGNVVGGAIAGSRNVISGNALDGVAIFNVATGNRVRGNRIGTDKTGTAALGNSGMGVSISGNAADNVVGGRVAAARNVISANGLNGVLIAGGGASGNKVMGNYIGTDRTGAADLGNSARGVHIIAAGDNLIGGALAGAGNVISGNDLIGIELSTIGATGNRIEGNRIGLAATSGAALGNSSIGIRISSDASNNVIGGTAAGAGNAIAHNGGAGVAIDAAVGNSVLRNRIFNNGGLGIDLGTDGVTANDVDDPDAGANNLQNFPVLTTARLTATGDLRVIGSINTLQDQTLRIEFFASPTPDLSGHGEGQRYLGFILVQTIGTNTVDFNALLEVAGVTPGQAISATATDLAGNTSEFSLALLVT